MNSKKIFAGLVLLAASQSVFASGGIVLGSTRVIYDANNKEASVTISNRNSEQFFLVQSWVDDQSGNKTVPFTMTPPLFRLKANKENMLRIIKTSGDLPADRESVYWVNVKAIPPSPADGEDQNVLQLAIKTRIKLFYRPKGLPGKSSDTPAALVWSQQGRDLIATNPTAYSVTLADVSVDGKPVPNVDLVMPKSDAHFVLPGVHAGSKVTFTTINDFGGVTPAINTAVK